MPAHPASMGHQTTAPTTPPISRNGTPALASSFNAGMRQLPRDLREDAGELYRLLRVTDDLVDDQKPEASDRLAAIENWARREPFADTPETHILDNLSHRHSLPSHSLLEFCEGMRHDLTHGTIEDEDDLEHYCQCAGGSVGVILASMFGTSHPDGERKMATLGRAFQRTNIIRDIDEDNEHGRLYIARTTIERFGSLSPGARTELVRDQIARADRLYDEGLGAIPLLSRGSRGMGLATALYREILRQIERAGCGRTAGRVTVPAWRVQLLSAKSRLTRHHEAA
ncbi:MAG: phytoene/squalene synthase family protein [Solirubrobacteraceae bacterium]